MRTVKELKLPEQSNLIKRILNIDNMYENIKYDDSPSLEEFTPNGVWFILMDGSDVAGLITLEYINYVLWVPHIFIFKQYRGNGSEEWGIQTAKYMRNKYGAEKFLALTPYKSAKKYAEKMGFKYITTLTKSIKKKGKLLDQYLLERE